MSHDGLLLLDKPTGTTSHDMVQVARRAFRQRKVGHSGTLDPEATGLLVLALGRATRLTRFLIRAPKSYRGVIRFGWSTDTYDATGATTSRAEVPRLAPEVVDPAMAAFVGRYEQVPPAYSAKKHKGKKYYELARRGEEVPREPVPVRIFVFERDGERPSPGDDRIAFRLDCSSGTYARALAHELGERLDSAAHLEELRRTRVGGFELEHAVTAEELTEIEEPPAGLGDAWIPFDRIELPFQRLEADATQERRVLHGQTLLSVDTDADEGEWIQIVNQGGRFVAVGSVIERHGEGGPVVVQPRVVFA